MTHSHWTDFTRRTDVFGVQMFAIYGFLIFLDRIAGFGVRDATLTEMFVASALGATMSTIALAAITLLARKLYLRRPFAQRHLWVFVLTHSFSVLASTILTTVFGGMAFPVLYRIPTFSLDAWAFYVLLLFALTIGLAVRSDYLASSRKLSEVLLRLSGAPRFVKAALHDERSRILAVTRDSVNSTLNILDRGDGEKASAQLSAAANDVVRPMSHALIRDDTETDVPPPRFVPSGHWVGVLNSQSGASVLPPRAIAFIALLFASRLSVIGNPPPTRPPETTNVTVTADWLSIAQAFVQLAITFGLFLYLARAVRSLVNTFVGRTSRTHTRWLIHVLSVIVVAGSSQIALVGILHIPFVAGFVVPALTIPLVFAFPVLVATATALVFRATTTMRGDVLVELERKQEELDFVTARLNEQLWQQRRGLAKVLHGALQAVLVSGAIQLHNAASDSRRLTTTVPRVIAKIERVLESLDRALETKTDVDRELALIVSTWANVCEIVVDADSAVLQRIREDPICQTALIDIVGEGVSNSVIHGNATATTVRFAVVDQRHVRITIHDNGATRELRNGTGMGTELFDYVCTEWSLSFSASGAVLEAVLPILKD